jgi:DNA-binding LytR/AlgR family response regulator
MGSPTCMKFVILEDETPAFENLQAKLRALQPDAWVYPSLGSVEKAIRFFDQHLPYDLVFADIHLQDGVSFDVLRNYPVDAPIVFTTAHDNYMQEAFELNSIDYLLKPVDPEKLRKTLEKYVGLKAMFNASAPTRPTVNGHARERIIVKRGNDYQLLPVNDIVYLFTENKLAFAVDNERRKFLCHETNLSELMLHLDASKFFRASRKFIINIRHLEKFHSDERSRIVIRMNVPPDEPILVSQENAAAFRKWVGQE